MALILHMSSNTHLTVDQANKVGDLHGFASFIGMSEVKLTVKARRNPEQPLPEHLKGLIKLTRSTASVNHNYEDSVQNKQLKQGEMPTFLAEESKISNPDPACSNGLIRQGKKDPEQKYLRLYFFENAKYTTETIYINANGDVVVPTEDEQIDFLPDSKKESKKQKEHGVEGKDQVSVREYKVENIFYFKKGDVVFNNLSKNVMKLFDLESV